MEHKCEHCEYSSDKAYNLKRHMTRKHKEDNTASASSPPQEEPRSEPNPTPAKDRSKSPKRMKITRPPRPHDDDTPRNVTGVDTSQMPEIGEDDGDDGNGKYEYYDAETGERLLVISMSDFQALHESIVASVLNAIYVRGVLPHPSRIPKPQNEE